MATSQGLYSYALETAPQDTPQWWVVIIAIGLAAGVVGATFPAGLINIFSRRRAATQKFSN